MKMPSPIRFFKKDPNKMDRGKGNYYKRGHFAPKNPFTNFEGSYFSKFDPERDKAIKAKGWRVSKLGIRADGKNSIIPHSGDGRKRI